MKLHLAHLYPQEMNIYGDTGNRLILERRAAWHGVELTISLVGIGDKLPATADIIIGGGGQDAGQQTVESDLLARADQLYDLIESDVVMLMICGMYQLMGREFITSDQTRIAGADLLPITTAAGPDRLIGNVVVDSQWGRLVGYENHSGRTTLLGGQPLGRVIKGAGNNGTDGNEGLHYRNVLGTYMHGPILSKNPFLADALLTMALARHGLPPVGQLDDSLELEASRLAMRRPR